MTQTLYLEKMTERRIKMFNRKQNTAEYTITAFVHVSFMKKYNILPCDKDKHRFFS